MMTIKQPPKWTPNIIFKLALKGSALGVAAAIGVMLFYSEPDTYEHLHRLSWSILFLLLGMIVFAWLCNGSRIFILSRSLGYRLSYLQSLSVSLSSEFGIAATPAGVGGAAIRLGLLKRAGVPLAHGTTMLAMDVALDSLFFLILTPFAVISIYQNDKIRTIIGSIQAFDIIIALSSVIASLVMIAFLYRTKRLKRSMHLLMLTSILMKYRLPGRLRLRRWKAAAGFHKMIEGFVHLLHLKWGAIVLTFVVASMQWTCRYSILPLLLYGLSVPCNPVLLFLLQGFLFTGSLLIVLPGGGGGVEISAAIILRQIVPPYLVGVIILLWRFFTYHLYLLGGGAMFFWTCSRLHWMFPKSDIIEDDISFDELEN
jgi:glycosyltransferase 2 family protein